MTNPSPYTHENIHTMYTQRITNTQYISREHKRHIQEKFDEYSSTLTGSDLFVAVNDLLTHYSL